MYTIGHLCKKFNLARSTLLYYDDINLLKPASRTNSNYRSYSEEDVGRLSKICMYRKTGVSLVEISEILSSNPQPILEKRLIELNEEISHLRIQQSVLLEMLKGHDPSVVSTFFDKNRFVSLLETIGMTDEQMDSFHAILESKSGAEHQNFLEFLGLSPDEIECIRSQYKISPKDA